MFHKIKKALMRDTSFTVQTQQEDQLSFLLTASQLYIHKFRKEKKEWSLGKQQDNQSKQKEVEQYIIIALQYYIDDKYDIAAMRGNGEAFGPCVEIESIYDWVLLFH